MGLFHLPPQPRPRVGADLTRTPTTTAVRWELPFVASASGRRGVNAPCLVLWAIFPVSAAMVVELVRQLGPGASAGVDALSPAEAPRLCVPTCRPLRSDGGLAGAAAPALASETRTPVWTPRPPDAGGGLLIVLGCGDRSLSPDPWEAARGGPPAGQLLGSGGGFGLARPSSDPRVDASLDRGGHVACGRLGSSGLIQDGFVRMTCVRIG